MLLITKDSPREPTMFMKIHELRLIRYYAHENKGLDLIRRRGEDASAAVGNLSRAQDRIPLDGADGSIVALPS
jgi:hypothetical protein